MTKKNIVFIELLRIIACFLVIVNHTNSSIFLSIKPSLTWFISLTYFFCCKIAVPIFIIIYGYLQLHKNVDYKKTFKSIIKIILVILIFSLLYYLHYKPTDMSVVNYLKTIYSSNITNAYWYLYAYLGILMMTPFLQKMIKNFEKKDFYIYFAISAIFFMIFPIIGHYIPALTYNSSFQLPLCNIYIFFLLVGAYLKRYSINFKHIKLYCILTFIGCISLNVALTYLEYLKVNGNGYLFYDNFIFLPVVLASISIFVLFSKINIKRSNKLSKIITFFGSLTFGIYLLSDYNIEKFRFINTFLLSKGLHPLLSMLLFEICVFLIGGLMTFILKKMPFIKKLI